MVYENDIVPELDEKLRSDFEKNKESNRQIAELDSKLSNGGTYRDAEAYAYEMGEALTKTFKDNLSSETLPDGKMYYNIFMRTVDPMIRETYKDATAAAAKAQANVNEAAGLHVKVKEAVLNDDRLHTMVNILTNNDAQYDDVSWVVEDKITNIIQSAVDDTMKANADFHAKMGMSPKIVREAESKCCEWCKDLAGTYEYPLDSDEEMVYHRHANCRCVVEYYPGDGRVQNAHDKTWRNAVAESEKQQRIEADKQGSEKNTEKYSRKIISADLRRERGYGVLNEYYEDATPKRGNIIYESGYDEITHVKEIETAKLLFDKFGGEIVLKTEKDKQKNPDYEWNGALWDLKSTTTEKAANSAIKSGMEQIRSNPGGIVLNFEDNAFSMSELIKVIDKRMYWYPKECADIMIISNKKVVGILRY